MREVKILAINTSPRKGKNTAKLMEAVLEGCRSLDANSEDKSKSDITGFNLNAETRVITESLNVADAAEDEFRLCRGCWACVKTGKCVLEGDFITEILAKVREADGVVFASPVFFCDISAQCKAIMDRSLGMIPLGTGKASATAITCGSVGANSALHTIQGFFAMHGFIDAGWVATYGKTDDKIRGKEVAHALGRKLVRLAVMAQEAAREGEEARTAGDGNLAEDLAHHNHFAYGTHTF